LKPNRRSYINQNVFQHDVKKFDDREFQNPKILLPKGGESVNCGVEMEPSNQKTGVLFAHYVPANLAGTHGGISVALSHSST
jgi:hypothetical protein